MKTSKEFFEKVSNDKAFEEEVNEALRRRHEAGTESVYESVISVAAEYGYEVTEEELAEIDRKLNEQVSDEELGKVAGGTSLYTTTIIATTVTIALCVTDVIYKEEK